MYETHTVFDITLEDNLVYVWHIHRFLDAQCSEPVMAITMTIYNDHDEVSGQCPHRSIRF